MLKSIVPVLLIVGGMASATAAEPAAKPTLGFEFGANFNLYNDNRFDGSSTSFMLVYQVNPIITAGVYHEAGHIHGQEDGADANIDTSINEFRVGVDLWAAPSGSQSVALMFGFGNASYSQDIDQSEIVADLAVHYSPIISKNGPVTGALNINAAYRYAPLNDVGAGLTKTVDDLGGFIIGLGAGLYF